MSKESKYGNYKSFLKEIVIVVLVSIIVRIFFINTYQVVSESMEPEIMIGDVILVKRWPYGYSSMGLFMRHYLFSGRILKKDPQVGDVVLLYRSIHNDGKNDPKIYVKRIIGTPGSQIQIINQVVHINGQPASMSIMSKENTSILFKGNQDDERSIYYLETLPNGYTHYVMYHKHTVDEPRNNTEIYYVPAGKYFVMGDNRDNSSDSRFSMVDMVEEDHIIGKVWMVIVSFSGNTSMYNLPEWLYSFYRDFRSDRFLKTIR